ncbi:hypothetical protein L1887_60356 [Cichorium endivia]|nr:hypothetical protein L1887_60353 [Cichorium endivia]KAI3477847.1 hypothetical protein L1887_60356 [Cichorium endivia]
MRTPKTPAFNLGLFPLHSPLLGESLLKGRHGRGSEALQPAKRRVQLLDPAPLLSEVLILSKPGRERRGRNNELSSVLPIEWMR